MPHIDIPSDLIEQIRQSLPTAGTVDGFVRAAIEDKLAWQGRRDEFNRLTDDIRRTMSESTITESEIIAEFDALRRECGAN
jgi:hypothetical protein